MCAKQLQNKECQEKRDRTNRRRKFKFKSFCALSLITKLKKRLNYWKQCAATIQIENVAVIELINANSRPIQRNNANT